MRLTVLPRGSARLVAATVLVAATGAVLPQAPAAAATCTSDTGVSVVVDASGLGGATVTSCVADGGGDSASSLFEVDHDLTRAARFPGAVCRVDGAPADVECQNMPPADAYWGLFWSDGSGGWVYSSEGVDSLNVPDGGSVAFAWQDGGDQDPPGLAPPQQDQQEPTPTPAPAGNDNGGAGGTGSSGSGSGSGGPPAGGSTTAPSATQTPSASGSPAPGEDKRSDGKPGHGKPSGRKDKKSDNTGNDRDDDESPQPSDDATAAPGAVLTGDPAPDPGADGLPTWVAPVGIASLFGIAGALGLLRRRSMS